MCPRRLVPALVLAAAALSGCSLFAQPKVAPARDSSLAPPGPVGYVACPTAVTPVELTTHTAEAPIPLSVTGTPPLGDFAITTSPDGRWAYVVTTSGVPRPSAPATGASTSTTGASTSTTGASTSTTGASTSTTGASTSTTGSPNSATSSSTAPTVGAAAGSQASAGGVHDVVVPINLVTQRALAPIVIPGQGATHAVVLMHNDRTILAASGSTIVPVDAVTHAIGTPLDLGAGRTIFGLALDPVNTTLYALVPGGVVPVDTADASAGTLIPTGLAVSSVYSPHGIAITGNGSTVYVVGQGGVDFGGRVLPIATATGTTLPATGFDRFGISDPAALAVTSDGAQLMVVDSANDWLNPVAVATFATPGQPVLLPQRHGGGADSGTEHPTDIVLGPGRTGAFVVDGFDSVVPYTPGTEAFGRAIPVCTGATSMTVAAAP